MTCTATHFARNRRRHAALLASCALGLVLAAMPQTALAQDANKGFQGVGTVDAGNATFFTTDGGKRTNIDVTTPRAVITWKPDDPATSGTTLSHRKPMTEAKISVEAGVIGSAR